MQTPSLDATQRKALVQHLTGIPLIRAMVRGRR